jgi:hypothetical protein
MFATAAVKPPEPTGSASQVTRSFVWIAMILMTVLMYKQKMAAGAKSISGLVCNLVRWKMWQRQLSYPY